jgi:hypothetical protein
VGWVVPAGGPPATTLPSRLVEAVLTRSSGVIDDVPVQLGKGKCRRVGRASRAGSFVHAVGGHPVPSPDGPTPSRRSGRSCRRPSRQEPRVPPGGSRRFGTVSWTGHVFGSPHRERAATRVTVRVRRSAWLGASGSRCRGRVLVVR